MDNIYKQTIKKIVDENKAHSMAMTFYKDIPIEKEDYAMKIGLAVIEFMNSGDDNIVNIIQFNKIEYSKWLNGKTDTQENRASWAIHKSNLLTHPTRFNKKECVCEICKIEFTGTGKSKFCSGKCRSANRRLKPPQY